MEFQHGLGVQSFCFRGFQANKEVMEKLKECGLNTIELCKKHVDFSDESVFQNAIQTYKDGGVRIVSIGVNRLSGDEKAETPYFEFAKTAGLKFMSVDFAMNEMPDCYKTADELAEKYDVRLCIHNHGGRHWLGSSEAIAYVLSRTSKRIGLCLDTAWALDAREDAVKMAERFADRLYGIHFKDFTFEKNREPVDVIVGSGNLDLQKLNKVIEGIGHTGFAVLEYEGDVDNPVPALKQCADAVMKEIPSLR